LFAKAGLGIARSWLPAAVPFAALLATYLWMPPNCGVPKYNLSPELAQAAPLDLQRLYLSVYPAPESAYRVERMPAPFGTTVRPGSTSMFAGIRFINGYSPIRPAGVAREFVAAIHGEISREVGVWLLESESGPGGLLARLGVDGIIVANEMDLIPEPATEWRMVRATNEGRVFHRGEPLPVVQSLPALDSRPNEQFTEAVVSGIDDRRNSMAATVTVPAGNRPALLAFSRPFFRGYRATIAGRAIEVGSYRGLIPIVELPAGISGRLELAYRPPWLIAGGIVAALSLAAFVGCAVVAARASSKG
jgi:hypothetical protein